MKKIFLIVLLMLPGAMALAQNTQDTIRMKVRGTSAEFSFTADKNAMYCVDWGDGSEERQACAAGEEKTLTHTYTDSNTYDITFFVYEEPIEIEMVWVEGGAFTMGCESEKALSCDHRSDNEKQNVTLTGYYISKYEITQAQWKAVMGTDPSSFKGDNLPVENISWTEAKEFCEKLSQKTGKNYTLPTEAQWEFAARGGVKSKGCKYSGSNTLGDVAWCYDNSNNTTHVVGTKSANELGIYDMSGNVWEWCADWYEFGSYSREEVTNPTGPDSGNYRVLRGSSWWVAPFHVNFVSYRTNFAPGYRDSYIGFRVVMIP